MVPSGMKLDLVIGEALSVTATSQGGRWTAQRIDRGPVRWFSKRGDWL
jgi:hypothetical protein